jgi:hypothetical protein
VLLRLGVTSEHKLLPQSAAVLTCELPGQGVEVSHPLHRDEERFVGREAGLAQLGDLVAQMNL